MLCRGPLANGPVPFKLPQPLFYIWTHTARAIDAAAGRRVCSWWVMFPAPSPAGREPFGMAPRGQCLVLGFTRARRSVEAPTSLSLTLATLPAAPEWGVWTRHAAIVLN